MQPFISNSSQRLAAALVLGAALVSPGCKRDQKVQVQPTVEEADAPRLVAAAVSTSPAPEPAVTIRHAWPPNWKRPTSGKLVVIQPWEFGTLPLDCVQHARDVGEFWLPSEYVRRVYLDSGIAGPRH